MAKAKAGARSELKAPRKRATPKSSPSTKEAGSAEDTASTHPGESEAVLGSAASSGTSLSETGSCKLRKIGDYFNKARSSTCSDLSAVTLEWVPQPATHAPRDGPGPRVGPGVGSVEVMAPISKADAVRAVVNNTALEQIEGAVGAPLTEDNLLKFQRGLQSMQSYFEDESQKTMGREDEQKSKLPGLSKNEIKRYRALQEIIESGEAMDPRSATANRIRKEHPEIVGMNRDAATKFRNEWVKKEFNSLEEKVSKTTSWSKVDKHKFKYRPLGKLVMDFGGWSDPSAVQGAISAAWQCISMGKPWALRHPQSKLMEFAVVEMQWQDIFEQKWASVVKEAMGQPAGAQGEASSGGGQTTPGRNTKPGKTPKGGLAEEHDKEKDKDKDKKANERVIREATQFKQEFVRADHKAKEVLQNIVDGKNNWYIFQDTKQMKDLKKQIDDIKLTDWQYKFVFEEWAPLRKSTVSAKIQAELSNFLKLGKATRKLAKFANALCKSSQVLPAISKEIEA